MLFYYHQTEKFSSQSKIINLPYKMKCTQELLKPVEQMLLPEPMLLSDFGGHLIIEKQGEKANWEVQ